MAVIIQIRRDTATDWTVTNPTLAQGEIGLETDTGKFKIGNGIDDWNSLLNYYEYGNSLSDGDKGDITVSSSGASWIIDNNAVTFAKMQNIATASILGRNTGGTGNIEALSDSTTKTLLSLNNVENTALSTWAGTTNITTLGTIATGTWDATAIAINKGGTGQTSASAAFDALSPMTTLGDIIYGGASGTRTRLAGNTTTTKKFLSQTGDSVNSAAPGWNSIDSSDISGALTDTVILAPGSSVRNEITPTGDFVPLLITGFAGQTASLFKVSTSATTLLDISSTGTSMYGELEDGTTLKVYASPETDIGSYALKIFNSSGSADYFHAYQIGGEIVMYAQNLTIDYNSNLLFGTGTGSNPAGVGYISAAYNSGRTTGYLNLDSSSDFNAGSIDISGGASAAGGSINTSNGGGSIVTNGSAGSIQLGVSATRTTVNGSGSAVTITLPAITGELMSLAGASGQTIVAVKWWNPNTLILKSGTGADTLLGTLATTNASISFPDDSGTVSLEGHTHSASDIVSGSLAIANGGTGQTSANAGFNALSPMTTLGDVVYGAASGAATRLAGNTTTTKKFLSQTGDSVNSAAPGWNSIDSSDISGALTDTVILAPGSSVRNEITPTGDFVPFLVKGHSSQTVDLFQIKNSEDSYLLLVSSSGDLWVAGNLTVMGTTTTINTQNVLIEDNFITLNSVAYAIDAGIEVERYIAGTGDNAFIRFKESFDQQWYLDNGTYEWIIGRKSTGTITGDSLSSSFNVYHNMSTKNVIVQVYDSSNILTTVGVDTSNANYVSISFKVAPSIGVTYRVIIMG